jgi:hypothetical protein
VTNRIAGEVAEATRVLDMRSDFVTAHPQEASTSKILVAMGKELEKLQAERRKLRAKLRRIESNIKLTKRHIRALTKDA